MNRNLILTAGFAVLLVFVFFASFFGLFDRLLNTKQKKSASITHNSPASPSSPRVEADQGGQPTTNNQQLITPTSVIDWQSIRVPEPGETPADKDTAIPKYTYGTNFGGTIRSFEISANQDAFSPGKLIVYQGDIVRIYLTSVDKTYDMAVSSYGNSMKVSAGENRLLEFQAAILGQFSLTCSLCGKGSTGILMVKPRS